MIVLRTAPDRLESGGAIEGGRRPVVLRDFQKQLRRARDAQGLDQVIEQGEVVVAFGMATGTWKNGGALLPENRWSAPAAWRVVVRAGQVAEWRVYCDNEPLRAIVRRNGVTQTVAPPS